MERAKKATVKIYVDDVLTGSGVVVGEGKIVTNLHVLGGGGTYDFLTLRLDEIGPEYGPHTKTVKIRDSDDNEYPATLIRGNQQHDLVMLEAPGLPIKPLPLALTTPSAGDAVTSIGYTREGRLIGHGTIDALNIVGAEPPCILHNAASEPGCSGGALVNERGQLIGIPYASGPTALPVEWVRELLARNDGAVISRAATPHTEIDYRAPMLNVVSGRVKTGQRWLQTRPQSISALEACLANYVFFDLKATPETEQLCAAYEDYFTRFPKRHGYTQSQAMRTIADLNETISPLYLHYLAKAMEAEAGPQEKALLLFRLAEATSFLAPHPDYPKAIAYCKQALDFAECSKNAETELQSQCGKARLIYPLLIECLFIEGNRKEAQNYFCEYLPMNDRLLRLATKENPKAAVTKLIDEPWVGADRKRYSLYEGAQERAQFLREALKAIPLEMQR